MFEQLYPEVYDIVLKKLQDVFKGEKIHLHEVSDVDRERFPYFVFYVAGVPRRAYLGSERLFEMLFRIRYVMRVPISKMYEAKKELLKKVGKFADEFDTWYIELELDGKPIKLLGDTADTGFATNMVRDGAYVIISASWVYRVEFAKYKS